MIADFVVRFVMMVIALGVSVGIGLVVGGIALAALRVIVVIGVM